MVLIASTERAKLRSSTGEKTVSFLTKEKHMINLGVIDILLLLLLLTMYAYATRRHNILAFYVTLVIVLLIEIERLVPGTLNAIGDGIRGIDAFNERLPHVQISPIITIK